MYLNEEEILKALEESDLDIDDELSEDISIIQNQQPDESESTLLQEEIPASEIQAVSELSAAEQPNARPQRWKISQFK